MKVLISAYACEPGAGSEPGAGWEWTRAAALQHDVFLLTRENNGPAIEAALAAEPELGITPIYLDLPRWARFWKYWPGGTQAYYLVWQVLVLRATRRLLRETVFEVLHHLTFAVDWMPAGVAFARRHPRIVWGPVGGSTSTPLVAWRWFGARGVVKEVLRECVVRFASRLFGRATARRAAVVVAQNHDVAARFVDHADVRVEPNVVVNADRLGPGARPHGTRAVVVGRLLHWKGIRLAIAALAEPPLSAWALDIYGDGPDAGHLRQYAAKRGVQDRVRFLGEVPRDEVHAALREASVLVHPSLHEAAGWVVAEALAAGCGVVCLDVGGPATLVRTSQHGQLVEAAGDLPRRLAEAVATSTRAPADSSFGEDRLAAIIEGLYDTKGPRPEHCVEAVAS